MEVKCTFCNDKHGTVDYGPCCCACHFFNVTPATGTSLGIGLAVKPEWVQVCEMLEKRIKALEDKQDH